MYERCMFFLWCYNSKYQVVYVPENINIIEVLRTSGLTFIYAINSIRKLVSLALLIIQRLGVRVPRLII